MLSHSKNLVKVRARIQSTLTIEGYYGHHINEGGIFGGDDVGDCRVGYDDRDW